MLICIVLLILLSAQFSACETAFSAVNKIRLKTAAQSGKTARETRRAARALALAESFDSALTAILIGNNLVNILAASLGTVLFTRWFGASGVGISTLAMTLFVLVFGEILPKTYAKSHAESLALFYAAPLQALVVILRPFIALLGVLAKGVQGKTDAPSVTEDELKVIVEQIEEEGVLEESESDLVRSALEFDEIPVTEVLVPRVSITAVPADMPVAEVKQIFLSERYSRLPVYDSSLDFITGFITEKDFFGLPDGAESIAPIVQSILRLPEFVRISEALRQMQSAKQHIAVVVDQYGGTRGIVTLEDIIEELVGEIYDEADEAVPQIVRRSANVLEVSGDCSVADLLEALGLPADAVTTECTSAGGLFTERAGHIAAQGETVDGDCFSMMAHQVSGQKVERILVTLHEPEEE